MGGTKRMCGGHGRAIPTSLPWRVFAFLAWPVASSFFLLRHGGFFASLTCGGRFLLVWHVRF
jgi:hypothetical protein